MLRVCWRRLLLAAIAFRLRPGDLLIADHEYHGNMGTIFGDRISLVAYLGSF